MRFLSVFAIILNIFIILKIYTRRLSISVFDLMKNNSTLFEFLNPMHRNRKVNGSVL